MDNPLFSVIVPVYNVEKYLEQCVESLIGQTFHNIEIILVDDGSTDKSPSICDFYATGDGRVKVIHKKNGGLVDARKSGIEIAIGTYIVCVDGDDWAETMYLENFERIISECNPDIICCGYYLSYGNGKKKECHMPEPFGYYNKERIRKVVFPYLIENKAGKYYPPSLWAKTFKRNLYKQHQAVSGLISVGEDHACTKPCMYHAKSMYILDKCLYNYRQNPESMTKKKKAFSWEGPKAIGQHFEKQIDMEQYDFQEQVYRNVVHNLFNVAVSQFNQKKLYKDVKKEILAYLEDEYYKQAIKQCAYRDNWKGSMAKITLKKKWVFFMWLYNCLKNY